MQTTDLEILSAFRRDPDSGARLLYARYYKPLVLFAGTLLRDDTFPEDMVQDAIYHFIAHRLYLRLRPDALPTYLFRVVRNRRLTHLRDNRLTTRAEVIADQAAEDDAVTYSPELVAAVRQAVERLPERTRLVITAIILRGRKYREAAEELGVTVNTVKTLLAHGLDTLRRQFPDPAVFFFLLA